MTRPPDAATVHLQKLDMTCGACPSQWEGVTTDGRAIYARYRHGYLSVGVGRTLDEAVSAGWDKKAMGIEPDDSELLFGEQVGDAYDGVMSTEEMLERTGLTYAD